MQFETAEEVLKWYESEERVLNADFLKSIPWEKTKQTLLPEDFIPVLFYMRDVERFTSVYEEEARRTPTGKDPVIHQFMERWSVEEQLHAELLNRFLNEAGIETPKDWADKALAGIPKSYRFMTRLQTTMTNLVGKNFTAVHMTWGTINELSTLSGYERLSRLANHPVLSHVLGGIMREEARHALFYWSVARIRLAESPLRQSLSRFMVDHFWTPVGQGTKPKEETDLVIGRVFQGTEGLAIMDSRVTKRIQQLPGFEHFTKLTERIAEVVAQGSPATGSVGSL